MSELHIEQWQHYEGDDWWKWAVWVEGPETALDGIEYVEWLLHPTFPDPKRRAMKRANKFRLETGGWGAFTISARVVMKGGTERKLRHALKLYYEDGTETTS